MTTLDAHTSALRGLGDAADDLATATATRLRIRSSLEAGPVPKKKLAAIAAAFATLFGGTVAWALVTRSAPQERASAPVASSPSPSLTPSPSPIPIPIPTPTPTPIPSPTASPSPTAVPTPAPKAATPRAPIEALYRRAHALHFHGDDVAAALAAWDAYLAAEPRGRFAIEARYNRALCLIRIGRATEARAALVPFATDQVVPHGYRHDEAAALIERLDEIQ